MCVFHLGDAYVGVVFTFLTTIHRSDANRDVLFDVTVEWRNFYDRVCAQLDIDPKCACIGYKYSNARQRDIPTELQSAEQLRVIADRIVKHNKHPNTCHALSLHIYNIAAKVRAQCSGE